MAHRQAGEADADVGAGAADQEAGAARIVAGGGGDLVGERGDLVDQLAHLLRLGVVAQAGDQFDGLADVDQIGLQLLRQIGVKHGGTPKLCVFEKQAARGGGNHPGPRSTCPGERQG
jgi:hypothetical protein